SDQVTRENAGRLVGGPEKRASRSNEQKGGSAVGPRGPDPDHATDHDPERCPAGAARGQPSVAVQGVDVFRLEQSFGQAAPPLGARALQSLLQQPAILVCK